MNCRALTIVFLLGAAAPVHAADAEIDFTQSLTSISGDPLQQCVKPGDDGKCVKWEPQTLGDVAVIALETPLQDDRDPKKKFDQDTLAHKIYKNAHALLSPDDVALIKDRIGKVFGPVQIGPAWRILDPTLAR